MQSIFDMLVPNEGTTHQQGLNKVKNTKHASSMRWLAISNCTYSHFPYQFWSSHDWGHSRLGYYFLTVYQLKDYFR